MPNKKINYLIGNAELLTKQVPGPKRKMENGKWKRYLFTQLMKLRQD